MELFLVLYSLGSLAIVGGIVVGRKYFLKKDVSDQAQSVRTPRDLGALARPSELYWVALEVP